MDVRKAQVPEFAVFLAFVLLNCLKLTLMRSQVIWSFAGPVWGFILASELLVFLPLWAVLAARRRAWWFAAFYVLQFAYVTANLWYFLYFRTYPSLPQFLGLFGQGVDLARHSAIPLYGPLLLGLIDLPAFAAVLWLMPGVRSALRERPGAAVLSSAAILLVFIAACWVQFNPSRWKQIGEDLRYFGDVVVVKYAGLPALQASDLFKSDGYRLSYSGRTLAGGPAAARRNIVLVQVEALDSFIVRQSHEGVKVMPFLAALSERCLFFPYMLTSHRGGGTSDCEFSLVNSVEPLEDRPAIMWNSYQYSNSFVKQLKKSGYACVAFHGNTGKFWNRSAAFLRMGYDAFEDTGSMGLPQDGWGVPDGPVLDLVLRTMKTQKRPFFFHVITMSSHEPYVNVPRYFTNSAFSGVRDDATRRYYLSMNYVDRCLEGFVTALLRDPTVTVLVMGDHCPVDLKGYAPARFEKAGRSFEFVPLFVAGRNVGTSGTPGRAASVLDLAPTILGLSGAGFAIRTDGDSLADGSVDVSQVPVCGVSFDRAELVEDLLAWRNRR